MTTYTTDDVARATGLSYRQVDHYVTQRYVDHPNPQPGHGHPRTFTDDQLDQVGAVAALISAGLRPRHAARIAQCPEFEHGPVQIRYDPQAIHDQLRRNLAAREGTP